MVVTDQTRDTNKDITPDTVDTERKVVTTSKHRDMVVTTSKHRVTTPTNSKVSTVPSNKAMVVTVTTSRATANSNKATASRLRPDNKPKDTVSSKGRTVSKP